MSRQRATGLNTLICMVLGVLCALSFGCLSDYTVFGLTLFNLFDYVSSNVLLPLGGMAIALFAGWVVSDRFLKGQIVEPGRRPGVWTQVLVGCIRYVAPLAIAVIFITGLM